MDRIAVSPSRLELAPGDTVRLTVTLRAAGGRELPDRTVRWTITDTAVATVTGEGLVEAVAAGAAIVRAQSDNRVGASAVTVVGGGVVRPGDTVVVDQPRVALIPGETAQLSALIVRVAGDTIEAVAEWVSSDEQVASVSASGLVAAVDVGSAQISANVPGAPAAVATVGVAHTFASIRAGVEHTCGVTPTGQALCWGVGAQGRLGTGETSDHFEPAPVLVTSEVYTTVQPGRAHTCALTDAGEMQCWGSNADGQLGIGSADAAPHPLRETVTGGLTYTALGVGSDHTCAVTAANETMCWGRGNAGELGDLLRVRRTAPDAVGLAAVVVASAVDHACALTAPGDAYCWGSNADDRLGAVPASGMSIEVAGFGAMNGIWGSSSTDVFAVGDQADTTCTPAGPPCVTNIWHNDGAGWTPMAALPEHLRAVWGTGPADVFAVGTGGSVFHYDGVVWTRQPTSVTAMLLRVQGTAPTDVYATGIQNTVLHYDGVGWTSQGTPAADQVLGVWATSETDVWVGYFRQNNDGDLMHFDGLDWSVAAAGIEANDLWGRSAADIYASGDGEVSHYNGQNWRSVAAFGTDNSIGTGIWGVGDTVFVAVEVWSCPGSCFAGEGAQLYFTDDGITWSLIAEDVPAHSARDVWFESTEAVYVVTGWEDDGTGAIRRLERVTLATVSGGNQFASITAGSAHTCAVTGAGTALCWGDNSGGQIGIGSVASRAPTPTPVSGGLAFARLSAGTTHTCGVTTAGEVYCWGENRFGEVGDGTTRIRLAPVLVAFDEPMVDVTAGTGYSCAVSTRGVGYCWGSNARGQLGDGTTEDRVEPQRVTGPR